MKTLTDLNLTELETSFVTTLIDALYAEPGFTDCDVKDISEGMNVSVETAKGVLGSLVKKGIVDTQEADHADFVFDKKSKKPLKVKRVTFDLVILNDNYYYLHPNWN